MVIASAPGKVTLFGEHAVVYGEPAIVMAINKRTYVEMKAREDSKIRINAPDIIIRGITLTFDNNTFSIESDSAKILSELSYVTKAIELVVKKTNTFKGVDIKVWSEMPVGAGLGTSASIAVATIKAYSEILGLELNEKDIAFLGWQTELAIQGIASPMDATITTYGGIIQVQLIDNNIAIEKIRTSTKLPIVIGYIPREYKTKDMVIKVKSLKEKYNNVITPIITTIGNITRKAKQALEYGNLDEIGDLMNINHGLLEALGVSTKQLNDMVYAARKAGALGSKLTGAGGGGCIIALASKQIENVTSAIRSAGGQTLESGTSEKGIIITNE
ncbi:MAG: mevalonate kinase [Thermoprotei archaeon]